MDGSLRPSIEVRRSPTIVFVLTPALLVFFADRLTKHVVVSSIPLGESITIVPGILSLTHMKNPGGAPGILGDKGSVVLLVASIIALVALVWLLRWFPASFFSRVGSGLVLGGAASNLLERMFIGAVTDYLDFPSWWVLISPTSLCL